MTKYFSRKELLKVPKSRAAFSGRMAYVMVEMSRIAYNKFEETEESKNKFSMVLKDNGFSLLEVFNNNGTQGFLCKYTEHKIAILAFRGTEITEYKDIKSDINAKLMSVTIGDDKLLIHSGFWKAFNAVKIPIKNSLEQVKDHQLFFTGHSLGGALATIALRYFAPFNDSSGACYTFGAPPVGTKAFGDKLKTPLYRISNNLDIVPHILNSCIAFLLELFCKIIIWILSLFKIQNIISEKKRKYLQKVSQNASMYRHIGYGSVLTGTEEDPKLNFLK